MDEVQEPKQEAQQPVQQAPKVVEKEKKPSIFSKLKEKFGQYKRTLDVARKPSKEEYLASAKITGIGILLLGFIGFIIYMIYHLVV